MILVHWQCEIDVEVLDTGPQMDRRRRVHPYLIGTSKLRNPLRAHKNIIFASYWIGPN